MRPIAILLLCLALQSCAAAVVTSAVTSAAVGTTKLAVKGTVGAAKLGYKGTKAVVNGTTRLVRGTDDEIADDLRDLPDADD